ncbi:copper resistance D family protein [Sulfitobacter sp. JB4-11]|uniref:copper resistance D family protein n=1 Tax=Sulfitobacter rhodophyticola TaxID=3238304 RepID=UPI003511E24A
MEGLAPIDGWAILAIMAKAAEYLMSLLAMGGPLFLVAFRQAPSEVRRLARRIAVAAALVGLVALALRFGIRAARISGMGLPGAADPVMLGIVWDSPLGTAAIWRGLGHLLVLAVMVGGKGGLGAALIGALLIAVSYTFIGHALTEPRWLLSALLTIHLLAVAFWIGALAPLFRAVGHPQGVALLHRFGHLATGAVAALVLVGVVFAGLLTGSVAALVTTAYGWTLLLKIAVVTGLMLLAAVNKWRLVPALASGTGSAATRLRRSIRLEAFAVLLILVVTATLTSVTTPPVNL